MCKSSRTLLIVWLLILLTAMAATLAPGQWSLDMVRVRQGEWWRLASGHFVHLSWRHYSYDLLALGLALYLFLRLEKNLYCILSTFLLSACLVSGTLLLVQPVDIYGGVSGITAGLLSWAAVRLVCHAAPATGALLMCAMLVKLCLEQQGLTLSEVTPVWQAHAAGAAAGMVVSAFSFKQKCTLFRKKDIVAESNHTPEGRYSESSFLGNPWFAAGSADISDDRDKNSQSPANPERAHS